MVPPQIPLHRLVALARRAEEWGYDLLACGEHVFFHVPTTNAFVALAAAAGATSRIRLLSAVTVLPAYPAALAAKMAATLDGVSGGRLELGVGVGGEFPAELTACGVDPAERGARTDEALEQMALLFAGGPVRHDGRFATLAGVRLDPLPVQRPGPPVWVGGRRPAALRRAARFGDAWLPYMVTPEGLAAGLATTTALAGEHGRAAPAGAVFLWSGVGRDGGAARAAALEFLAATYRQDFTGLAARYVPAGTPAEVTGRLREYGEAGARTVVFAPACADGDVERTAEEFAREVAPALRDVPVPGPALASAEPAVRPC